MENKNLMTEGPYKSKIIRFAVPVLFGSLFQQLYNMVDSLIVGNFVGDNALAAVSSAGNLLWLICGFFNGMFIGAGVVTARYIGAHDDEGTKRAVSTTVAVGIIISVILTALGLTVSKPLLILIKTPAEVLPESLVYFRWFFTGITGMIMYNALCSIIRASGDSKTPVRYLIIAAVNNVVLDLVFVGVLKMGVAGAAIATAISQLLSATLALIHLLRVDAVYRLHPGKIGIHWDTCRHMIRYGMPVGFQSTIIQIANVLIQSFINGYGPAAVAGLGAWNRVEGFAFMPIDCFGMALTTFVGQNLGAGHVKRTRQGVRFGVITGVLIAEFMGLLTCFAAPYIMQMFTRDPEVIAYAVSRARVSGPLYFTLAISNITAAVIEGCGKATSSTIVYIVCWCAIRCTILIVVRHFTTWFGILNWVYPITWSLTAVWLTVLFKRMDLQKLVLLHKANPEDAEAQG